MISRGEHVRAISHCFLRNVITKYSQLISMGSGSTKQNQKPTQEEEF